MRSDFTAVQAELRKHRQDYRAEKQQVAPRPDQAPPTPAARRTLVGTLRQARVAADNFEHGVALLFLLLLFLLPLLGVRLARRRGPPHSSRAQTTIAVPDL